MTEIIRTKSFQLAVNIKGDREAKKLAIALPGRLDTKDYEDMKGLVDYLAISFDPPGTWESSGRIEDYTMTNYLMAINELIEYFGNRPTIVAGHSRGGTMAMLVGLKNNYVTHIISIMSQPGPSTIKQKTRETGFDVSYRDTPSGNKIKFELPLSYFEGCQKYDFIEREIVICNKPKLFIAGLRDEMINPDRVVNLFNKCIEPKQLGKIDCTHDYRHNPKMVEEINNMVGKFLETF